MSDSPLDIKELPDGIAFRVRVQPRSSKNKIAGIMGNCLKINLTAPPVDGAANTACITFVASLLDVAKSAVAITNGQSNRSKVIKVTGVTKTDFFAIISLHI
ncbi:MAG: hypothetical protein H6Q71_566 [Firmicutes bacterium]|nr:hypothetical protein [Bacillota bacterium]